MTKEELICARLAKTYERCLRSDLHEDELSLVDDLIDAGWLLESADNWSGVAKEPAQ